MKVLLATDGSVSAKTAGSFLARLPHSDRMELTVMAVAPILELFGTSKVIELAKQFSESEKERATKVCQLLASNFEGANTSIEVVVAEGSAGAAIVEQAKKTGCELIVLGAIGHSALERWIQGSVSDFVATHAHCSVLVVRPDSIPESDFNICVAYDASPQCEKVFDDLARFHWGKGTQLNLVNAVAVPFSFSELPVAFDIKPVLAEAKEVVSEAVARIKHLSSKAVPHVIEVHHLGVGLVDFAEQHQSNLIMMGDTGLGLAGKFLLGSVSRYILRHAHCSVWIARKG